jgi:hypothetical protein
MKNIHVLPTDKPSRLHFTEEELVFTPRYEKLDGVNIYITSDEEIKEGDYVCASGGFRFVKTLNNDKARTFKDDGIVSKQNPSSSCHLSNYKKIILTTDQDLIDESVQAIDDEFLEWFVKNPSCEKVKVEGHIYKGQDETEYKIIIPKEEPKQEYQSECICDTECRGFVNVKCKNLNKQETLEEAYNKIYKEIDFSEFDFASFAIGVKFQQERMYSEEDMRDYAIFYYTHQGKATKYWGKDLFKEWFKQFKKK